MGSPEAGMGGNEELSNACDLSTSKAQKSHGSRSGWKWLRWQCALVCVHAHECVAAHAAVCACVWGQRSIPGVFPRVKSTLALRQGLPGA